MHGIFFIESCKPPKSISTAREQLSLRGNAKGGFSLIEILLVIAIIGLIAAFVIPTISRIRESAERATAMQNAKNVAQMSEALGALGVAHVIPDSMGGVEATARLFREGVIVPEGPMAGERFSLSGMEDSDIERISEFLEVRYASTYLRLVYNDPAKSGGSGSILSPKAAVQQIAQLGARFFEVNLALARS